jgi:hypothetical protein
LGFGLQIGLVLLFGVLGLGKITESIYSPWLVLGNAVLPSGAGGHAMSGGVILGLLVGVFVYSSVLGVIFYRVK